MRRLRLSLGFGLNMNIFEMYYDNQKSAGFWVIRDSWKHIVARVVSIAGIKEGALTGLGRYPFFNEAKTKVYAEIYEVHVENNIINLKQKLPVFSVCQFDSNLEVISCPGTYAYTKIDFSGKIVNIQKISGEQEQIIGGKKEQLEEIKHNPMFEKNRAEKINESNLENAKLLCGNHFNGLVIKFDELNQIFVVSFPYNPVLVEKVKVANSKLRQFNALKKEWFLDVTCIQIIESLISN